MIKINAFKPRDEYYAARNSHTGFVSLFARIFNPREYEKIYILKGGPGTGKSTILRGLCSFASENDIDYEAVYCSSDPASLDGVILSRGNKKIAVIDGTAPHATEAKYPGAVEDIINLGDGFKRELLRGSRSRIITLSEKKSNAYKSAYFLLAAAGRIFDDICTQIKLSPLYNEAEAISKELANELYSPSRQDAYDLKIYSSFSRSGLTSLTPKVEHKLIKLSGECAFVQLVLNRLKSKLCENGQLTRFAPSALDDRIIDRLYTQDFLIIPVEKDDDSLDLAGFELLKDIPRLNSLLSEYNGLIEGARRSLDEASGYHFSLEDIYKNAVDFSFNERAFSRIAAEIGESLSNSF